MASIAEERGGEVKTPFSYKSSELVTIAEGLEAVAISKVEDSGKKAELPCLSESMELHSLNAIPSCEFEPSTPVRYLGLCCGASMHVIRSLVDEGRYFAEIYLCDMDPLARHVALDSLQRLATEHPENFSAPLRQDIKSGKIFEYIPQDVRMVDSADVITLVGVNLVIASPDCHPFKAAGKQLGFEDTRSSSFVHCLRIVWEIYNMVHQPLTYVVENVPGAGRFESITDALGLPLSVSAHRLGSSARRETLLWTNSQSKEFLLSHLMSTQVPVISVGEVSPLHGFDKERTPSEDLRLKVFPKSSSRIGSNAYRLHDMVPGSGMLLRDGKKAEPENAIRALAMGFPRDHLLAPTITAADRPKDDLPLASIAIGTSTPKEQRSQRHVLMCHLNHLAVDSVPRAHELVGMTFSQLTTG
jgi:hypothetical protein